MKSRVSIVVFILITIGIVVTAGLMFNKMKANQEQDKEIAALETGAVPQMNVYYGKEKVGELSGYTMDMDTGLLRDIIVPISTQRELPIQIKTNKNTIESISFEVNNQEDGRLIDSGNITGWEEKEGEIFCDYSASTIIKPGEEFLLTIHLCTDKHQNINYYTRVMVEGEEFVEKQIKFAKEFSDKTFDKEKATDLAAYLEQDQEKINDNLGQVTIQSSYSMLIWNTLNPKKDGATAIRAKEYCIKETGEAGTYTMTYRMRATNAQKVEETYLVSETITVWSYAGKEYVLAYDREVNQIWEETEHNVGNAFIDLGIQNITEIEHVESNNHQFIAYAISGDVYVMDVLSKKMQTVYRLDAVNAEQLNKTKAKAIKVDDSGNVDYMIYGYSPSNNHAGKNGISIMRYDSKKKVSTESAFIPDTEPAQILEKQLSELCYVGDGTLYLMVENTIYYTNLKTKEWGILMANLEEGSLAISENGTTIAYNTNGKKQGSDDITVVDLSNGKMQTIDAGEGNQVMVCGYTGENLIYGIGKSAKKSRYDFFPINTLEIKDKDLKTIKSYSPKGILITGVEIKKNIINIKRWKDGKEISDDQLLENTEDKVLAASSSYYMDDIKQKELAISFTNNLDAAIDFAMMSQGKVVFNANAQVEANFAKSNDTKYYVYGYGKLQAILTDQKKAIKLAREVYGLVASETGKKLWVFEEHYNS